MKLRNLGSLLSSAIGLSIGFDIGFTIVILSLRYFLGFLNPDYLRIGAGILLILFGIWMVLGGEINIPGLNLGLKKGKYKGFLGGIILGLGLSASWSPCAGPILAGIISMITTQPSAIAFAFLFSFLLGMNLCFILLALFIAPVWNWMKASGAKLAIINRISGVLLLVIGLWLLSSIKLPSLGANLEGILGYKLGLGVAFLAGIITFLSPCTLPMMPIIIVGLGGLSMSDIIQEKVAPLSTGSITGILPPKEDLNKYLRGGE